MACCVMLLCVVFAQQPNRMVLKTNWGGCRRKTWKIKIKTSIDTFSVSLLVIVVVIFIKLSVLLGRCTLCVLNLALWASNLFGTLLFQLHRAFSVECSDAIQIQNFLFIGQSHENLIIRFFYFVGCFGHHAPDGP